MELFKNMSVLLGIGLVLCFVAFACVILIITLTAKGLEMGERPKRNCAHKMWSFDDGHPDYPWVCSSCGKRMCGKDVNQIKVNDHERVS